MSGAWKSSRAGTSSGGGGGWGDDEEDENYLPQKQETKVNAEGIKTVTEYKFNEVQQKVKVVKKVKVLTVVKRVSKAVAGRRERIQKFGDAKECEDESNVTIIDYNEVKMLTVKESENEDGSSQANVSNAFAKFQEKQKWRALQRKYDDGSGAPLDDGDAAGLGEDDDDKPKGGGLFGKAGTKYVPPGARGELPPPGGAAGGGGLANVKFSGGGGGLSAMAADDRDYTSLRVMNISEDTKEADLQELFERFGRIFRIYLAKDRETGESRGFAFVSFSRREDAERAMEALQGYGYDHLILKIEWAKPSTKEGEGKDNVGAQGTTFRSGYGKALAQDTKEKVSFASNLTANK